MHPLDGGTPWLIQVKTRLNGPKNSGWKLEDKHMIETSRNLMYCFVDLQCVPEKALYSSLKPFPTFVALVEGLGCHILLIDISAATDRALLIGCVSHFSLSFLVVYRWTTDSVVGLHK